MIGLTRGAILMQERRSNFGGTVMDVAFLSHAASVLKFVFHSTAVMKKWNTTTIFVLMGDVMIGSRYPSLVRHLSSCVVLSFISISLFQLIGA